MEAGSQVVGKSITSLEGGGDEYSPEFVEAGMHYDSFEGQEGIVNQVERVDGVEEAEVRNGSTSAEVYKVAMRSLRHALREVETSLRNVSSTSSTT
ncbi:hypothetical protein FRX31_004974 [Thalictrum thalictroides]|uniref:Uncharacterized protein n=1 Tax=Thalictrum thalictroides TaxID=46969 RepID=A0A7J6XAG2_THATH|nr:hypothetical protein FRX31_004974 [Thalictrum thalictroides]